jgi:hypothetical protein
MIGQSGQLDTEIHSLAQLTPMPVLRLTIVWIDGVFLMGEYSSHISSAVIFSPILFSRLLENEGE